MSPALKKRRSASWRPPWTAEGKKNGPPQTAAVRNDRMGAKYAAPKGGSSAWRSGCSAEADVEAAGIVLRLAVPAQEGGDGEIDRSGAGAPAGILRGGQHGGNLAGGPAGLGRLGRSALPAGTGGPTAPAGVVGTATAAAHIRFLLIRSKWPAPCRRQVILRCGRKMGACQMVHSLWMRPTRYQSSPSEGAKTSLRAHQSRPLFLLSRSGK